MRPLLLAALLVACGGSDISQPPTTDAAPRASSSSVCLLPDLGGGGVECDGLTLTSETWWWADTSQGGEVVQRCSEVACPSGAMCFVQQDVSGLDDGGAILTGTCQ